MITSLKTIKNISTSDLTFDDFILSVGISQEVNNDLRTSNNFIFLKKYFLLGKLSVTDNNDNQITDIIAFEKIWMFWVKIIEQKYTTPNYFKIYDFLTDDAIISNKYDISSVPKSVDYIKDVNLRFARKETFTLGFLTNVEYYESSTTGADNITYFTNPILNVNMQYFINSVGYVSYRQTTRKWMKVDGTYSPDTKITIKQYNGIMSREEGIQRRNNIINQLVIDIINVVYLNYYQTKSFDDVEMLVLPLMDSLDSEINKYLKANLQPLIIGISNASSIDYPWLDLNYDQSTTLHNYIENTLLGAILSEGMYTSQEPS